MEVLVTGGAGYIGSHVALSLLDSGYDVTVIDDLSTGNENLIPIQSEFIQCNINNSEKIESIIKKKKFIAIMHFAGFIQVEESIKFPEKYLINNTKNSALLFKTCLNNGLNNIIFSSTAAVYGDSDKKFVSEETNLNPLNPYAVSKELTEKHLLNLVKNTEVNFIILRYFNVAGADSSMRSGLITKKSTHLIKIACEAALGKRNSVKIFGNNYNTTDGTAIRDYIHVTDLADIHIKSLEYLLEKKISTIMNCGYGKGYSVKEVLDVMNKICDGKIKIEYAERRPGDAISLVSDVSKLMKIIKWTPIYNNLEKILKTAITWEKKLQNEEIL